MAYTQLTTQVIAATGIVPSYTAALAAGHMVDGDGDLFLAVINASAGSINVTVNTPATQDGLAVASQVVAVAASTTKFIGPFPPRTYNVATGNTNEGKVEIDYSAVTSVTVGVFSIG